MTTTRLAAALLTLTLIAGCSTHYTPGPLTNSTPCGVLTADQGAGDTADITGWLTAANPYAQDYGPLVAFQAEQNVLPAVLSECGADPGELLSAAYNRALNAVTSG